MFSAAKDPTNEPHFLAILAFADRRPANCVSAQFSSDYYFSQFCGLNWVWSLQVSLSHMSAALLHLVPSTQPVSCFSLLPNIAIGLQLCMVAGFPRAKSRCHQVSSGLSRNWYNVTSFDQSTSQSCPDSRQGETDSTF